MINIIIITIIIMIISMIITFTIITIATVSFLYAMYWCGIATHLRHSGRDINKHIQTFHKMNKGIQLFCMVPSLVEYSSVSLGQ